MELELKGGHIAGFPYAISTTKLSARDAAFVGGAVVLMRGLALAGSVGQGLASALLALCDYRPIPRDMPPIPLAYWLAQVRYGKSTFYGFVLSTHVTGQMSGNAVNIPMERIVNISAYPGFSLSTNVQTIENSVFAKIKGQSELRILTVAGELTLNLPAIELSVQAAAIPDLELMRQRFDESLKYNLNEIARILGNDFLDKNFGIKSVTPKLVT